MEQDNQLYHMVGRIDGKMDSFLAAQERTDERLKLIEHRVTNLETIRHRGTGQLHGFTTAVRWGWVVVAAGLGLYADKIKEIIIR